MKKLIPENTKKTIIQELAGGSEREYVVGKGAELHLYVLIRGSGACRVVVRLVGRMARADIVGIVVGRADGQIALHTMQLHQAPETTSNLLVKAVLRDRSAFLYDGAIRVEKDAQKTDAYQRNENLLLSPHAHADSRPALEILANDVRCTHGATVTTVSPEQLWYLESRGISGENGKKLLVGGFVESALSGISDTIMGNTMRNSLWQIL